MAEGLSTKNRRSICPTRHPSCPTRRLVWPIGGLDGSNRQPDGSTDDADGIAKLSVVGIGMRSHSGVAAKMFEALSASGVNIQMISTSEIKTAVIIEEGKIEQAANLVHEAFGLGVKG